MNGLRTTALSLLLALQGQAAVCPQDLIRALDCSSAIESCCSEVNDTATNGCSCAETTAADTHSGTSCGGNCQLETHDHPSIWQIQTLDRFLARGASPALNLRLKVPQTDLSSNKYTRILEAPPGPSPRLSHCIWRL